MRSLPSTPGRRGIACAVALLAAVSLTAAAAPPPTGAAGPGHGERSRCRRSPSHSIRPPDNAVSDSFADTFADPSVIRGHDGCWYAYGTTDPLREGERARSRCTWPARATWSTWEYVGTVFDDGQPPRRGPTPTAASVGARRALRRRPLGHVLHRHRTTAPPGALGDRGGHRAEPDGPVDVRPTRRSSRPAPAATAAASWTFDPAHAHRPRRPALPLLRQLLRRHLGHRALRGRPAPGRRADPGGDRQQLRGRVRRAPRRLVLPVRVRRRTAAPGRPRATRSSPGGPARRPGRSSTATGIAAGRLPGRRHGGGRPERQPLGRRRAQRAHHRRSRVRTASPTTRSTAATRTSTSRSGSTSGRC